MDPKKISKKWDEKVITVEEKPQCHHVFQFVDAGECRCRKCGMGLMGVVDIVDGKPV